MVHFRFFDDRISTLDKTVWSSFTTQLQDMHVHCKINRCHTQRLRKAAVYDISGRMYLQNPNFTLAAVFITRVEPGVYALS